MNRVIVTGRLTRDPETRQTQSDSTVVSFGIAVDRRFKRDGEPTADFFNCVAFGKTAEFVQKYFTKGMKINLEGHMQTGSYTNKEGQKVNTFNIIVDECEFGESKAANDAQRGQTSAPPPIVPPPAPQAPPMYNNTPPVQQAQQAQQTQYQRQAPQQYAQQQQPVQQQYAPQQQRQQPAQQQQQYYQQSQQDQQLPEFMNIPPNSPDEIPFP